MEHYFDIIVIGAGHAGSEAAMAAANLGANVLIITSDCSKISHLSCNPSIGGVAKGQLVREIDALGGYTGVITDKTTIQFRMLNISKGPAMWSPRALCDRIAFSSEWRKTLEKMINLKIWQDNVSNLIFDGDKVVGVKTCIGASFFAKAIIITTGTFLNGLIHVGRYSISGGRIGEPSNGTLSEQLRERGVIKFRMKTGTPPRIDIRSINLQKLTVQQGDEQPSRFSFLPYLSLIQKQKNQLPCFITYTSEKVHELLRSGFKDSPLFSGRIKGLGPRHCPSIEDKIQTFIDKEQHPLFLEPEGWNHNEYYLQGFSTSLPIEVQIKALRAIEGFENVWLLKPGYAIEYDYFPPTQLLPTLELKTIPYIYLAGQINGTTGYEEAAAQGIMAGINAFLKIQKKKPFILKRDQAYIGVLIDDLVTKGVDEPYRMFTSRAEYRILLRQDNADLRLTPLAQELGLASTERWLTFQKKSIEINRITSFLKSSSASPQIVNSYLNELDSSSLLQKRKWEELLSRPKVTLNTILKIVPRETGTDLSLINPILQALDTDPDWAKEIIDAVEISVKYAGYIQRELENAKKILRLDYVVIPNHFVYEELKGLSIEARQKLTKIKPTTIGQASRIPGVSPADISVLLLYFGR